MPKDYIPKSSSARAEWLDNFVTTLAADKARFNLTDAELADLTTANTDFQTANSELAEALNNYNAKLAARNTAETAAISKARSRVRQIQANPNITDTERATLRLTLRDTEPTPMSVPQSFPVVVVDNSKRLRHTLKYFDSDTPTSRARPANSTGAEVARYIGTPPPTGPEQFQRLDESRRSPYMLEYTGADVGKTAYYMLRWVNSRGEKGPWSETVSATITG